MYFVGPVASPLTCKSVSFHDASKPFSLTNCCNVNEFTFTKNIYADFLADLIFLNFV